MVADGKDSFECVYRFEYAYIYCGKTQTQKKKTITPRYKDQNWNRQEKC